MHDDGLQIVTLRLDYGILSIHYTSILGLLTFHDYQKNIHVEGKTITSSNITHARVGIEFQGSGFENW